MRRKIVAGNWKMSLNYSNSIDLAKAVSEINTDKTDVIISPSSLYLSEINRLFENSGVKVSSQNCYFEDNGAYTGEISVEQLSSVGINYSLVGHSERRSYLNESNAVLKQKVDALLTKGLIPIYCVGETLDQRKSNSHFSVIESQIKEVLYHLSSDEVSKVIIAYEPVWAIGTGETATSDQAQEMHLFIREKIKEQYDQKVSNSIRILYGGSCKPENAKELFSQPDIDGGLIGGAALKFESFNELVETANSF